MKRRYAATLLLLLGAAGDPSTDIVAQRGDLKMTAADVRAMLDKADPAVRAKAEASTAALASFVRDRMLDQAMLAEAKAKGWEQRPDVQQRLAELRDQVVLQTYVASLVPADPAFPSDAEIAAAYDANKSRLMLPRQYHIAQIAILGPAGATRQAEDDARRKAAELRAQVVKPKADFAELARKHSQDKSSADKGGDLGWLREDELLPAIKDPVANLADNAISEPLRLPDGYHILRLLGTRPASPAPLADVKQQLIQALRQARSQQIVRAYVDAMLKAQPIQLNEIDLPKQLKAN